jgi:ribose 5-phosphate isomerase B
MTNQASVRTIHLASDHAGFTHKEAVKKWLLTESYTVVDHGAKLYEPGDDFTDFIGLAAAAVSQNPDDSYGIIFGGSGQGEAMLANRFPKVRATVYYGGETDILRLSREHNDANVLSFGARFVDIEETKAALELWLSLSREIDERHSRRIKKIETITKELRHL